MDEKNFERIRHGMQINDVVEIEKVWCAICAKCRAHEKYKGWTLCLGCFLVTEPPIPFSVDSYVKGESN